jgi:hypothetical protein
MIRQVIFEGLDGAVYRAVNNFGEWEFSERVQAPHDDGWEWRNPKLDPAIVRRILEVSSRKAGLP